MAISHFYTRLSWMLIYLARVLTSLLSSCHLCPLGQVKSGPHTGASPAFCPSSQPLSPQAPECGLLGSYQHLLVYKLNWSQETWILGPAQPLAMWPWASHTDFLDLCFPFCKTMASHNMISKASSWSKVLWPPSSPPAPPPPGPLPAILDHSQCTPLPSRPPKGSSWVLTLSPHSDFCPSPGNTLLVAKNL